MSFPNLFDAMAAEAKLLEYNVHEVPVPRTVGWQQSVMFAAAAGKRLQLRQRDSNFPWVNYCGSPTCLNWAQYDYRIAPEEKPKKLVPWTHETFPRELIWIRAGDRPSATCWRRVLSFTERGVFMGEFHGSTTYLDLCDHGWVYSLDNGKTWSRCGVEVAT